MALTIEGEETIAAPLEKVWAGLNDPEMLKACMFTNSPDEHFVLDRLPDVPQVAVFAGESGHGYKFCSVVGEVLADLVIDGATRHDIGLFRIDRFGS